MSAGGWLQPRSIGEKQERAAYKRHPRWSPSRLAPFVQKLCQWVGDWSWVQLRSGERIDERPAVLDSTLKRGWADGTKWATLHEWWMAPEPPRPEHVLMMAVGGSISAAAMVARSAARTEMRRPAERRRQYQQDQEGWRRIHAATHSDGALGHGDPWRFDWCPCVWMLVVAGSPVG